MLCFVQRMVVGGRQAAPPSLSSAGHERTKERANKTAGSRRRSLRVTAQHHTSPDPSHGHGLVPPFASPARLARNTHKSLASTWLLGGRGRERIHNPSRGTRRFVVGGQTMRLGPGLASLRLASPARPPGCVGGVFGGCVCLGRLDILEGKQTAGRGCWLCLFVWMWCGGGRCFARW